MTTFPRVPAIQYPRFRLRHLTIFLSLAFAPHAMGNPLTPVVVNGSASFASTGKTLLIQNTPGAIINWQSFSIAAGETTRFLQQSSSSQVLNRVVGGNPSQILGTLSSNGQVFLINPNGIVFGTGSQVNVSTLVASTLGLSDHNFLGGALDFQSAANPASLINQGSIQVDKGGYVYLLGSTVQNHGLLAAPGGQVLLVAGTNVRLLDPANPEVVLDLTPSANQVINTGQINAGNLKLLAADIVNSGQLNANAAEIGPGGSILLTARDNIQAGGQISADALEQGNGGSIQLLSQGNTTVSGSLSAKGGADAGNGGSIETSGSHVAVGDSASINTTAAHGKQGSWLIDPTDITITASGGDISGSTLSAQLNQTDVTLQTSSAGSGLGDIIVNDAINWSSGYALSLTAYHNIYINQNISGNGANLNLSAGGGLVQVSAPLLDVTLPWSSGTLWFTGSTPQTLTTLALSGGTVTADSNLAINNYNQSGGTLNGAGTVTATSGFSWTGGTMSGTGSTVVGSGVSAGAIHGSNIAFLDRTLINQGSITQTGGGTATNYLYMGSGSVLNNQGTYSLDGSASTANIYGEVYPFGMVINSGTLQTTGAYGGSITVPLILNGGTLNVGSGGLSVVSLNSAANSTTILSGGTLSINNPTNISMNGMLAGDMILQSGANLAIANGSLNLLSGQSISGGSNTGMSISGGTLTADGNISVGSLNQSGGMLGGAGTVTASSGFSWTGGWMYGTGSTVIGSGVSAGEINPLTDIWLGRALVNKGSLVQVGNISGTYPNMLVISNGGVLNNQGSYSLNSVGTSAVISQGSSGPNPTPGEILNSGVISTTGSYSTKIYTPVILEGGTLNVGSGSLSVGSLSTTANTTSIISGGTTSIMNTGVSGTLAGNVVLQSGAHLDVGGNLDLLSGESISGGSNTGVSISGGTLTADGNISVGSLNQSGGMLDGAGTVTASSGFSWTGGGMYGTGSTVIGSGVSAGEINPLTDLWLGRALVNQGSLVQVGNISGTYPNMLVILNGGVLNNQGSYSLNSVGTSAVISQGSSGSNPSPGEILNSGLMRMTGSYNTKIYAPVQLSGSAQLVNDSSQTLQIGNLTASGNTRFGGSGVIELTGPASLSGTTTVAPGASLIVDAGNSFSSTGSLNVQGNLQFNSNVTLDSDLQLQSGSLYLNGITLNENQGTLNWSGGAISGSGGLQFGSNGYFSFGGSGDRVLNAPNIAFTFTDLTLPSGSLTLQQGSLTLQTASSNSYIPTGASLNVNGGVLTNNGPLSVAGALNINGGVFAGTGTVSVDGGSLSMNGGSWSNSGALSNSGTLNLGSGSYAGQINNLGTINMAGASFSQLFSNSGTLNLLSATSSFNGGLLQTGGVIKLGTDVNHPASMLVGGSGYQLNNGTLEGSGNINGNVSVTGGTLSPGYSPGSININGNLTLGAGSNTVIQIGGTTPGIGFDQITVSGTASLGGALTVSLWNGYSPAAGSSYRFLQYGAVNGSFASISLPGTTSSLNNMAAYAQIGFAAAPNSFASMPAPVSMSMQDAWEPSASLNRNVSVLTALATTQVLPMNLATDLPVFYDWSALSFALNCK